MTMRVYDITSKGRVERGTSDVVTGTAVDYMGSVFPPCSCPRCRGR